MATMHHDRLVEDYLRRLDTAASVLPTDRRTELVDEIHDHIRAAVDQHGSADEADVRNILERLGPPDEIVAEAVDREDAGAPGRAPGIFEIIALLVLAAGGFAVPVAGWVAGTALVLISRAWTTREKQIGLIGPLAVLFLPMVALGALGAPNLGPLEILVLTPVLGGGVAGLIGAVYLALRLRANRA